MNNLKAGLRVIGMAIGLILLVVIAILAIMINMEFYMSFGILPFVHNVPLYLKIVVGILEILGMSWLIGFYMNQ